MVATATRTILENLDRIPDEDGRTKISIVCYDTSLYFFSIPVSIRYTDSFFLKREETKFSPPFLFFFFSVSHFNFFFTPVFYFIIIYRNPCAFAPLARIDRFQHARRVGH